MTEIMCTGSQNFECVGWGGNREFWVREEVLWKSQKLIIIIFKGYGETDGRHRGRSLCVSFPFVGHQQSTPTFIGPIGIYWALVFVICFVFLHLLSSFWWKEAAFHAKGESIDLLPAFLWKFTLLLTKWRVGKKSGCQFHDSLMNKWRISDMREFVAQFRNTGKVRNRQLSHTLKTYLFHETGINFINHGYFSVLCERDLCQTVNNDY